MNLQKTSMKQSEEEVNKIFQSNDIFVDNYKYIDYNINPIILQCSIFDIKNLWNEKAKVRENFSIDNENKTINLPNFFVKINGAFENKKEWKKFKSFLEKDSSVFYDFSVSQDFCKELSKKKYDKVKDILYDKNFEKCKMEDFVKIDDLCMKKISNKTILDNLNSYMLNYVFKKLKNFIDNSNLKESFKEKVYLNFILNVLYLDDSIAKQLNEWDFSSTLPKVVIYDEYEKYTYNELNYLLIDFLNYLGIDIIILSPSGKTNIESFDFVFNNKLYTNIVLDKFLSTKKTKKEKDKQSNEKIEILKTIIAAIILISFLLLVCIMVSVEIKKFNKSDIIKVEEKIDNITEISYESISDINDARNMYNHLSNADKKKVTNIDELENYEQQYSIIKEEKIKEVETFISEINEAKTDDEKEEKIKIARQSYDQLETSDKKEVSNYTILVEEESIFSSFEEFYGTSINYLLCLGIFILSAMTAFNIITKSYPHY